MASGCTPAHALAPVPPAATPTQRTSAPTLPPSLPSPPARPPGGGVHDSHVVKGMVLKRGAEGSVQRVADAKVAVFAQGVDTASTETKVGWLPCGVVR